MGKVLVMAALNVWFLPNFPKALSSTIITTTRDISQHTTFQVNAGRLLRNQPPLHLLLSATLQKVSRMNKFGRGFSSRPGSNNLSEIFQLDGEPKTGWVNIQPEFFWRILIGEFLASGNLYENFACNQIWSFHDVATSHPEDVKHENQQVLNSIPHF